MLLAAVERWLDALYIGVEGTSLRQEDRRKAVEVAAILQEVDREARRISARVPLLLVDAAAGKSYVGLLAAKLVLESLGRDARVVTLERDAERVAASERASARLASVVPVECRRAQVSDRAAWPDAPSIVVALHACGPAADDIIDVSVATRARTLLLVPCCTSDAVPTAALATQLAAGVGMPRHAAVRRRFLQSVVDAERTWRLEAAGYQTEVVEMVGATVTPHNLLWRARFVGEPKRMAAAARQLEQLRAAARALSAGPGRS